MKLQASASGRVKITDMRPGDVRLLVAGLRSLEDTWRRDHEQIINAGHGNSHFGARANMAERFAGHLLDAAHAACWGKPSMVVLLDNGMVDIAQQYTVYVPRVEGRVGGRDVA